MLKFMLPKNRSPERTAALCRSIRNLGKVDPILLSDTEKLPEIMDQLLQNGDLVAGNMGLAVSVNYRVIWLIYGTVIN